jgi:protein LTV1
MSSSVIRRNKQLCLLDDRFEKLFEGYEDTEIGALDLDEIEGHVAPESDLLLKYANEYEKEQNEEANLNHKINKLALQQDDSSNDELTESDEEVEKEKWDCESILSTYSTTKNRPKLIKETSKKDKIKVNSKGIPDGVFGKGLTKSLLKEMDQEYDQIHGAPATKSIYSEISAMRTKDETPEQRHERKKLLKEFRKERRMERKANTDAFKDEKKRQEKVRLNAKANLQGLKL